MNELPVLISDDILDARMSVLPAPRVTKEYIKSRIKRIRFLRFNETTTICEIVVNNGFSVRGESACVCPENYVTEIGQRISYDKAFEKLWPLFGFALAEQMFQASNNQGDQ